MLQYCDITDGLAALDGLAPSLRALQLRMCTAAAYGSLSRLTNLHSLSITSTGGLVGDSELKQIAQVMRRRLSMHRSEHPCLHRVCTHCYMTMAGFSCNRLHIAVFMNPFAFKSKKACK